MMPVASQSAPESSALKTCIEVYRQQAQTEPIEKVWKRFRASTCGKSWIDALKSAYGHRCLYCDHAESHSIDHRDAKSATVDRAFAWSNFRPSCGDCNRLKSTLAIVDPLSEDPRDFIEYDLTTGKPTPITTPARQTKAKATSRLLDHQTLNDARRAKRQRVLNALVRFLADEAGHDEARVIEELAVEEPHRAIVRDLVLGAEADLHQWSPLVRQAMRKLPVLKTWTLNPTA